MIWHRITDEDESKAPFDGNPVLLYTSQHGADLVWLGVWTVGSESEPSKRRWHARKSASTDHPLTGGEQPTHWAPFTQPS